MSMLFYFYFFVTNNELKYAGVFGLGKPVLPCIMRVRSEA
jgi:hypothetical protein